MKKTESKTKARASRRAAPRCSHLLGTAMRTIDDQHIIVYVTDWNKAASYKVTDRFNYCPKCGARVNANVPEQARCKASPGSDGSEVHHG
jgi:ribosomal protein S27AE